MRESRIGYYQPGFRSPLYPWVQIAGFLGPLFLIAQMGAMAVVFTAALCMGSLAWYHFYARGKVKRDGAIYHVFERLGRNRDLGLDRELREILGERTEGDQDGFDRLVSSAVVVDHPGGEEFQTLLEKVCGRLAARHHVNVERLVEMIVAETRLGLMPVARGVALPHLRLPGLDDPEMVILRVRGGVEIEVAPEVAHLAAEGPVYAILLLASPEADPSRHLRMLARLASRVDTDGFLAEWRAGQGPRDLRAALLRVSKTPSPSDSDEDPRRSTPNTRPPGVSAPPREAT
jgi:mannitol/fructose-specific phosphotransferase system IIA component (Ntr-type)